MGNYLNPPITESLFDFQVEPNASITSEKLEELANQIAESYPEKKPRRRFESRFEFKEGQSGQAQTVDLGIEGYLCWNADKTQALQFRLNGYSFSRLKPYKGWDIAYPEAIKYWEKYLNLAKPISVRRLGVRFINTINIPAKKFDLDNYFLLPPQTPKIQGIDIKNFLTQVTFQIPEQGIQVTLIQTIGQSQDPTSTPIILDIELGMDIQQTLEKISVEKIFTDLRKAKNDIFENCITDQTRELFQ